MLEFILGMITAWWVIPLFCFINYFSIRAESTTWAIFFTILILFLVWFTYSIPLSYILGFIVLYIPIGIAWSIRRFNLYCNEKVKNYSKNDYHDLIYYIKPSNNIDKIVSWIIVWPFSLIDTTIGNIIYELEKLVKEKLYKIYDNIYKKYLPKED